MIMNNGVDYYKTLGVDPKADVRQIKEAYRKMAFKFHPDRNRDNPAAAEQMKAVNEAYAVLCDPAKRQRYDRMRRQFGPEAYSRFRSDACSLSQQREPCWRITPVRHCPRWLRYGRRCRCHGA